MDAQYPRELRWHERLLRDFGYWAVRQRRRFIPYLVWHGQEIDVAVTFKENRLSENETMESGMLKLKTGPLREIENKLSELGVDFDTGVGFGGRDWEWDWSLRGPISVTFRRQAKHPERRQ